jgi:hypothetical protein
MTTLQQVKGRKVFPSPDEAICKAAKIAAIDVIETRERIPTGRGETCSHELSWHTLRCVKRVLPLHRQGFRLDIGVELLFIAVLLDISSLLSLSAGETEQLEDLR